MRIELDKEIIDVRYLKKGKIIRTELQLLVADEAFYSVLRLVCAMSKIT